MVTHPITSIFISAGWFVGNVKSDTSFMRLPLISSMASHWQESTLLPNNFLSLVAILRWTWWLMKKILVFDWCCCIWKRLINLYSYYCEVLICYSFYSLQMFMCDYAYKQSHLFNTLFYGISIWFFVCCHIQALLMW